MSLRLGKVITAIQRIKPDIQEEACKVALSNDKATGVQTLLVAREDEIDIVRFEIRGRLDDAVRRHDGDVFEHERLESGLVEEVGADGGVMVHDQGVRA